MSGAKEIRTKIGSVTNTQKITKAMEMVAASKLRRTQQRMAAARPYADKIRTVIGDVRHLDRVPHSEAYKYVARRGIDRLAACRGCSVEGFCAGGCSGIMQYYSGDIYDSSDPDFRRLRCTFMRHMIKESVKAYFRQ